MWARVLEIAAGVWLGLSPFIFGVQHDLVALWTDLGIALVIFIFSGLSFWGPTRYAYLLNFAVAVALCCYGRFANTPPTVIDQNHIATGIFLLMVALVPNDSSLPPQEWLDEVEVGRRLSAGTNQRL